MAHSENANRRPVTSLDIVPEPGQLIEVRRRRWIVNDVQGSALGSGNGNGQHLVTLSSLDEDALGEELQVVWQIEPGARVLEKAVSTVWTQPFFVQGFCQLSCLWI